MHWTPWRPVEPAPVDPAPWADTGDARRILFGGHAMRDEGTDSTAHFSVCGNPESWSTAPGPDFIEHQLATRSGNPNGRAYNRTAFLSERRGMMQAWADYLDRLRAGEGIETNEPISSEALAFRPTTADSCLHPA